MASLLSTINSPADLKRLDPALFPKLADEMREYIREFTAFTGGHIGSGLGVVELTIALHRVFDCLDRDKLILDTGHQCYPHKLLTGRRGNMMTIRQAGGISGFPDPKESPYDLVKTGHGGASIATAVGIAVGMQNAGLDDGRRAIAVIGDSALQEGMALEALNHGGSFKKLPLIVILNDNEMGISPAVGAMAKFFSKVRSGKVYRNTSDNLDRMVGNIERDSPGVGGFVREVFDHMRAGAHSMLPAVRPGVLFEALGYFYYGPIDGHDFPTLLQALESCRRVDRPVVLHCITHKGKGYSEKADFYRYHAGNPDKAISAHLPREFAAQGGPPYTDVFVDEAMKLAREDKRVVALTAAMLQGTGLAKFQAEFPDRCHDVGMAEQHCVGMAQGLLLAGQKPICAVYSTFMQRAIDQIFQEVALINLPLMMCLDRAGVVGPDGATHNGVFDIAYSRMLPNMTVMAPRDGSELRAMMRMSINHSGPTAIRFPRCATPRVEAERAAKTFAFGESELLEDGRDGALVAYGAMVYPALDAAAEILRVHGKKLAVVNARFAKPLDAKMLEREFLRQPAVFTLEDHAVAGGFGSAVLEHASAHSLDIHKLDVIGIPDRFIDHGQRIEALAAAGLDVPSITARVCERLGLVVPDASRPSARLHPGATGTGTISPPAFAGAAAAPESRA
jgi:1-deoxy-D-xylulose-5-phosphate synthase